MYTTKESREFIYMDDVTKLSSVEMFQSLVWEVTVPEILKASCISFQANGFLSANEGLTDCSKRGYEPSLSLIWFLDMICPSWPVEPRLRNPECSWGYAKCMWVDVWCLNCFKNWVSPCGLDYCLCTWEYSKEEKRFQIKTNKMFFASQLHNLKNASRQVWLQNLTKVFLWCPSFLWFP